MLATRLRFALTIWWDVIKARKQPKDRGAILERFIRIEPTENRLVLGRNEELLERELQAFRGSAMKMLVLPLTSFRTGFRDSLKGHLPPLPGTCATDLPAMMSLFSVYNALTEMNEAIRSREALSLGTPRSADFSATMRIYDEALVACGRLLREALGEGDREAKKWARIAEELLARNEGLSSGSLLA